MRRGSSLGSATVEASDRPTGATRTGTVHDARAAWLAVGPAGRTMVLIAWASCVALAIAWLPTTGRIVATAIALAVLVLAALVDVVEHRLPNALVTAAALPVVLTVAVARSADVGSDTLMGMAFVGVPLLVTHLVAPAGMGFGDVKAGLVVGAALGLVDPQVALLALVLGLAAGAVYGLARRARTIPLGPFLVAGAVAALATGDLLAMSS